MLLFGSVCAIIVSTILFRIPRTTWPISLESLLYEIRYNVMGNREIFCDWLYRKSNKKITSSQKGRVAIVTGGSRGIGLEVVRMLMNADMEVIIACRNVDTGNKAIQEIRKSGVTTGEARVYKLDNASLASVTRFTEEVKQDYNEIHLLVNNAGIMFGPYRETVDGFEQQWAVNYLSHFLLTSRLMPLLSASGKSNEKSRIVNVTSCAHLLGRIHFADIRLKHRFITAGAYAQSKLAQVIFTRKLQDLLKERECNVQAYSVHPGVVYTDIFVHSHIWKYKALLYYILKTPIQGAIPIVFTGVSKALEDKGGSYISNCRISTDHSDASNRAIQDRVFELSLQQVQLKDFFQ